MPVPARVDLLPKEIRAELDRRIVAGGFAGYVALSEWLAEQGYEIKKSALHEHGKNLRRKLEAIKASTQAAAAIAAAAPDDADLRSAAVMSLVQTDIFNVLVALQEAEDADPEQRLKLMSRAARSIAELSRASVNQKKWQADVRARAQAAAEAAARIAKRGGLSADSVAEIRREILGIVA